MGTVRGRDREEEGEENREQERDEDSEMKTIFSIMKIEFTYHPTRS